MKKTAAILLTLLALVLLAMPFAAAEEPGCPAWGDIDGDRKVTPADARLILRQSVSLEHYPEEALRRCDFDKDGKITSADARFTLRLSVNLEKAPPHVTETLPGRAATCTEAGLTEGTVCTLCGETLTAQDAIPAAGHTEVVDEAVAPTCTETGLTEGKHCSVCNAVRSEEHTSELQSRE